MKTSALREMTKDELIQKLNDIREAQFNLTFQQATGQLDNTAQLPKNKKDIARILTILSEMDSKAGA
ncbi:MAG TPA: 50S ribosomal protein L29 [Deltaproteobacteria bacterium]|jgi:large subunit ribosomal protein L29|nr:50S ribosomal protein L29 [Deltaproteobacteria bacterium]HIJ77419.1 50S ribosomal protein L29 [Deltaproteobacteria bacterium]